MEEIWKAIPNYEGYYEVSNTGKVRSVTRIITFVDGRKEIYQGSMKSLNLDKYGYYYVILSKDNQQKTFKVHRLVALAFIPNPKNLPVVNHKDENSLNNNVDNLEWCTIEYNNTYGTKIKRNVENNPQKKKIAMCNLITKETIKTFDSVSEAARQTNICRSGISRVINGKSQNAGGYFWKVVDNI